MRLLNRSIKKKVFYILWPPGVWRTSCTASLYRTTVWERWILEQQIPVSQDMSYLTLDTCKLRRAWHGGHDQLPEAGHHQSYRGDNHGHLLWCSFHGSLHPGMIKEEDISVTWEPKWQVRFTPENAVHPKKPARWFLRDSTPCYWSKGPKRTLTL